MRMHAVRAQPDEMSLANQQPGRRGLLLLRERATQRTALLPGARAHCLSVARSAAPQPGCVSYMLRRKPITGHGRWLPERKPDERGHPLVGACFKVRRGPIAARWPTIVLTV